MKKILFLSPYPMHKAPSQRLKYEQYYSEFQKDGYELHTRSFVSEPFWNIIYKKGHVFKKVIYTLQAYFRRFFVLFGIRKYDIVYVHLWVTPFGIPLFESLVVLFAKKVVYDIDDMIFLGHSSKANAFIKSFKGKSKMIYLMKKAHHVITCTETLDAFVRKHNNSTTDISSTVNTKDQYFEKSSYLAGDVVIIGWSGSHSTSKYLSLLSDVFVHLSTKYNIQLVVMGDKNFRIEGVNINAFDWTEDIEIETIASFDIGVYPLPDEQWVYGKSGLKAIQYMGMGVPAVASAIGANFRIIQDGVNGFLASDQTEWIEKLSLLIENPDLREKLGKAGRKTIVEQYSVEANKNVYLKIFEDVIAL